MACLKHAGYAIGCEWCASADTRLTQKLEAERKAREAKVEYRSWQTTPDGRAYSEDWEPTAKWLARRYQERDSAWATTCKIAVEPMGKPNRTLGSPFEALAATLVGAACWLGAWLVIWIFVGLVIRPSPVTQTVVALIGLIGAAAIAAAAPVAAAVVIARNIAVRRIPDLRPFDPEKPETLPAWWSSGDPRGIAASVWSTVSAVNGGAVQRHIHKMPLDRMGVTVADPRPDLPEILNELLEHWIAEDIDAGLR